ncbi:MAG TPA: aspartyl protease family protein [Steroidobacteraceae bacterium]|nr:aspartyl protease family protein [Steroidobacteraceae bacterium]
MALASLLRLCRTALPVVLLPLAIHLSAATAGAANRCKLTLTPPLAVKMESLRPVISTEINGVDARFMVDTGSFFDFISPAAVAQFNLPLSYAPSYAYVSGVGGSFVPKVATAKTFTVAGVTAHDAQFLVGDNDLQGGIAGLLGQNLFRIMDVEFDFADGVLRFARPQHCGDEELAYWATTQPIGVVDLHWTSQRQPHLIGNASVNGHEIEVLFDTGSARTVLSLRAAKRAGITPESPGVMPAGVTSGLGRNLVRVWSAPVEKFEIGGEAIEHTRVLIGDIGLPPELGADMLLGSDFFLAHHVYVAYSQNKLYFTYNGGPVFALNARQPAPPAAAPLPGSTARTTPAPGATPQSAALPGSGAPAGAGAASAAALTSDIPTDAAGFMRRGMAEISRGEFSDAIADLTRACDSAPGDAACRYERGLAYWHGAQPQSALADFDAAIQLQPNDFDAYLARAELELHRAPASAQNDLDAVDRLAPAQWDLRLTLARLYAAAGEYAGAVHQYDLWIEYHADDIRMPLALSNRCGSEAAANVDVDRALGDCNTALHLMPKAAPITATAVALSNRGLVYLRQGMLDKALADFDAALKLQPELPLARYARGLVELKKGLRSQGQADLGAARTQAPGLTKRLTSIGLTP